MSIKEVTRYETSDGKLFTDEIKAIKHQSTVDLVAAAKNLFPNSDIPTGEYIQLTQNQYDEFKRAFDDVLKTCHPDLVERNTEQYVCGGFLGRLLNDYDSPVYKLWWLLGCVDNRLRMYNQHYYANHPKETANWKRVDSA